MKKLVQVIIHVTHIVRFMTWSRIRWVGFVAWMWGNKTFYTMLVGKSRGKGPLGKQRRRWEDNIKEYRNILGSEDGHVCTKSAFFYQHLSVCSRKIKTTRMSPSLVLIAFLTYFTEMTIWKQKGSTWNESGRSWKKAERILLTEFLHMLSSLYSTFAIISLTDDNDALLATFKFKYP
jgi:hypothetical protein